MRKQTPKLRLPPLATQYIPDTGTASLTQTPSLSVTDEERLRTAKTPGVTKPRTKLARPEMERTIPEVRLTRPRKAPKVQGERRKITAEVTTAPQGRDLLARQIAKARVMGLSDPDIGAYLGQQASEYRISESEIAPYLEKYKAATTRVLGKDYRETGRVDSFSLPTPDFSPENLINPDTGRRLGEYDPMARTSLPSPSEGVGHSSTENAVKSIRRQGRVGAFTESYLRSLIPAAAGTAGGILGTPLGPLGILGGALGGAYLGAQGQDKITDALGDPEVEAEVARLQQEYPWEAAAGGTVGNLTFTNPVGAGSTLLSLFKSGKTLSTLGKIGNPLAAAARELKPAAAQAAGVGVFTGADLGLQSIEARRKGVKFQPDLGSTLRSAALGWATAGPTRGIAGNLEAAMSGVKIRPRKSGAPLQPGAPEEVLVPTARTSAEQEALPVGSPPAAPQPSGQIRFTTSKGSTYEFDGDTSVRNKAARPEHPGEVGQQPRSEKTFFVDKEGLDKLGMYQTQGASLSIEAVPGMEGHYAVRYLDGPNAGKFAKTSLTKVETSPRPGLYPVEIWNGGRGGTRNVHFGNEITHVEGISPPAQPKVAPVVPVGKARPDMISASREVSSRAERASKLRPAALKNPTKVAEGIAEAIEQQARAQEILDHITQSGDASPEAMAAAKRAREAQAAFAQRQVDLETRMGAIHSVPTEVPPVVEGTPEAEQFAPEAPPVEAPAPKLTYEQAVEQMRNMEEAGKSEEARAGASRLSEKIQKAVDEGSTVDTSDPDMPYKSDEDARDFYKTIKRYNQLVRRIKSMQQSHPLDALMDINRHQEIDADSRLNDLVLELETAKEEVLNTLGPISKGRFTSKTANHFSDIPLVKPEHESLVAEATSLIRDIDAAAASESTTLTNNTRFTDGLDAMAEKLKKVVETEGAPHAPHDAYNLAIQLEYLSKTLARARETLSELSNKGITSHLYLEPAWVTTYSHIHDQIDDIADTIAGMRSMTEGNKAFARTDEGIKNFLSAWKNAPSAPEPPTKVSSPATTEKPTTLKEYMALPEAEAKHDALTREAEKLGPEADAIVTQMIVGGVGKEFMSYDTPALITFLRKRYYDATKNTRNTASLEGTIEQSGEGGMAPIQEVESAPVGAETQAGRTQADVVNQAAGETGVPVELQPAFIAAKNAIESGDKDKARAILVDYTTKTFTFLRKTGADYSGNSSTANLELAKSQPTQILLGLMKDYEAAFGESFQAKEAARAAAKAIAKAQGGEAVLSEDAGVQGGKRKGKRTSNVDPDELEAALRTIFAELGIPDESVADLPDPVPVTTEERLPVPRAPKVFSASDPPVPSVWSVVRSAVDNLSGLLSTKTEKYRSGAAYQRTGEIELASPTDYGNAIHEAFHQKDWDDNIAERVWVESTHNPTLRKELVELSKFGSSPPASNKALSKAENRKLRELYQTREALSVLAESYAVNPDEAKAKYPAAFSQLDPRVIDALDKIGEGLRAHEGAQLAIAEGSAPGATKAQREAAALAAAALDQRANRDSQVRADVNTLKAAGKLSDGRVKGFLKDLFFGGRGSLKGFLDEIGMGQTDRERADARNLFLRLRETASLLADIRDNGGSVALWKGGWHDVQALARIPRLLMDGAGNYTGLDLPPAIGDASLAQPGVRGLHAFANRLAFLKLDVAIGEEINRKYQERIGNIDSVLTDKDRDPSTGEILPSGIKKIEEAVTRLSEQRKKELEGLNRGVTPGMDNTLAAQVELDYLRQQMQAAGMDKALAAAEAYTDEVSKSFRNNLDLLQKGGVISPEQHQRILGEQAFYVQQRAATMRVEGDVGGAGFKDSPLGRAASALPGRRAYSPNETLVDPFQALMADTVQVVSTVQHNNLMNSLRTAVLDAGTRDVTGSVRLVDFNEKGGATGSQGWHEAAEGEAGIPIYNEEGSVVKRVVPEAGVVVGWNEGKLFLMDLRPLDANKEPSTNAAATYLARLINAQGNPSLMAWSPRRAANNIQNDATRVAAKGVLNILSGSMGIASTIASPAFITGQVLADNAARPFLSTPRAPGGKVPLKTLAKDAATAIPRSIRAVAQGVNFTLRGDKALKPETLAAAKREGVLRNTGAIGLNLETGTGKSYARDLVNRETGVDLLAPPQVGEKGILRRWEEGAETFRSRFPGTRLGKMTTPLREAGLRGLESARVMEFADAFEAYKKQGMDDDTASAQARKDAMDLFNAHEAGMIWQWLGNELAPMTGGHADGIRRTLIAVKDKPVQLATTAALMMGMSYAYHRLMGLEDDYEDVSPEERARSMVWIMPGGEGRIQIPVAYPLVPFKRGMDWAWEREHAGRGGTEPSGGGRAAIAGAFKEGTSFGPRAAGAINLFGELMHNTDSFGNPIVRDPEVDPLIAEETNRGTPVSRALVQPIMGWGARPEQLDHMVSTLGGAAGQAAVRAGRLSGKTRTEREPAAKNLALSLAGIPYRVRDGNSNLKRGVYRETSRMGDQSINSTVRQIVGALQSGAKPTSASKGYKTLLKGIRGVQKSRIPVQAKRRELLKNLRGQN